MTLPPGGDRNVAWVRVMPTNQTATRAIGPVGTIARAAVGVGLLVDVAVGQASGRGLVPVSWLLGVVGLPALVLIWQGWRARRRPARLDLAGPRGYALTLAPFLVLFVLPLFVPGLSVLWDAGLIFVGVSLLGAAVRGYAGCEVLALSNWLLRRDDQVGCIVFTPIDNWEDRHRKVRQPNRPARE